MGRILVVTALVITSIPLTPAPTKNTLPNTGRMVAGLIGLGLALVALGSAVALGVPPIGLS
jgi:hypothetical protein